VYQLQKPKGRRRSDVGLFSFSHDSWPPCFRWPVLARVGRQTGCPPRKPSRLERPEGSRHATLQPPRPTTRLANTLPISERGPVVFSVARLFHTLAAAGILPISLACAPLGPSSRLGATKALSSKAASRPRDAHPNRPAAAGRA